MGGGASDQHIRYVCETGLSVHGIMMHVVCVNLGWWPASYNFTDCDEQVLKTMKAARLSVAQN